MMNEGRAFLSGAYFKQSTILKAIIIWITKFIFSGEGGESEIGGAFNAGGSVGGVEE